MVLNGPLVNLNFITLIAYTLTKKVTTLKYVPVRLRKFLYLFATHTLSHIYIHKNTKMYKNTLNCVFIPKNVLTCTCLCMYVPLYLLVHKYICRFATAAC